MRLRKSAFALSAAAIITTGALVAPAASAADVNIEEGVCTITFTAEEDEQAKKEALDAYEADLRTLAPEQGAEIDALFAAVRDGSDADTVDAAAKALEDALGDNAQAKIPAAFAVAVGKSDDVLGGAIKLEGLSTEKAAERDRGGNMWTTVKDTLPQTFAFSEKLLDAEDTLVKACATGEAATGIDIGFSPVQEAEEKKEEEKQNDSLSSGFSFKLPNFNFGSS